MKSNEELRAMVRGSLREVVASVNTALRGKGLGKLEGVLKRLGRGQQLPHWFEELRRSGTLPNLDGKSIGSVVEMVLVGILETGLLRLEGVKLRINPARGVDLPDLDLGVKSPSENYCTSEPFFSAYERLYGSEHDVLVLLTDYQERKKKPPLRLQITNHAYLTASEVADRGLCAVALKHRDWLIERNEAWAKKFFKFLAYVNQSDWLARQLLGAFAHIQDSGRLTEYIQSAEMDFGRRNAALAKKSKLPIPDKDLEVVRGLAKAAPVALGIIDAADNWVVESFHEASRLPNTNEWERLKRSPLNGKIGVSPALQWRYNFGRLFNGDDEACEKDGDV